MGSKSNYSLFFLIPVIITVIWGWGGIVLADNFTELRIPQGLLQGRVLISREGKTFNGFMGIPYAQAPKRFEPARLPPPSWVGIYNATNYGEKCLQFNYTLGADGSEDCLLINVFTPNTTGNASVMAFIPGGAFQGGASSFNGPEYFLDHDIVLVTFGYRLGALGFLSTGDEILPGNLGIKDQNLALRWIQDNIRYFGGDKDRVTLFGESAGAASVSFQILSPLSRGLFRHAITQSGTAVERWAITEDSKLIAGQLATRLNCSTNSSREMIDCLKDKPGKDIVEIQLALGPLATGVVFGPVIETGEGSIDDPAFLSEHPRLAYEEGRFARVPYMITFNNVEGLILNTLGIMESPEAIEALNNNWTEAAAMAFILRPEPYTNESIHYVTQRLREYYFGSELVGNETFMNLIDIYSDSHFAYGSKLAALYHAKYAPVYTGMMGFKGTWSWAFPRYPEMLGMTHADDMQYLFRDHRYPQFPPGSETEDFSKLLVRLWVNFANTGDPNYELRGKKWSPLEFGESREINWLYLKNEPEFVLEPWRERMALWEHLDEVLESGRIGPLKEGVYN